MSSVATREPAPPVPGEPPGAEGDTLASSRRANATRMASLYVVSVAVALGVVALLVLVVGHSPGSVFSALFRGSVSSPGALGRTLDDTIPVLLVALGTLVAVRAGMFNIGQTGQLVIGAICAAFIVLHVPGPGPLIIILALVCGLLGGGLWAGLAAWLYTWRGINVVISTLLLTYVATQILSYSVSSQSLLEEPSQGVVGALPQSSLLRGDVRLPHPGTYPSFGVSLGLVIAVGLLAVFIVLLSRSRWGVRLRMVGANPVAARRFGFRVTAVASGALIVSGALAGLAGSILLTGEVYRIQGGFANTYGNDGLLAALVCRNRPALLLPVAFVFGMIRTGGNYFLSTGVPDYLAQVLKGLLVLAAVFPPVYLERREWARRLKAARALAARSA
ncbi:MAG: ABC transporter permease [Acidimicrobiales bacterium]